MFQLRNSTVDLELSHEEEDQLLANFESALIKMLYAFLWQEWVITDKPIIFDPDFNEAGATFIRVVNAYANSLNDFPIYDQDLQNGVNIYPGDYWCNDYSPHAKWHLEASAGVTDLIYLAEDMYNKTMRLLP